MAISARMWTAVPALRLDYCLLYKSPARLRTPYSHRAKRHLASQHTASLDFACRR